MNRFKPSSNERLYWRVFVHTEGAIEGSRSTQPLSWHLVACTEPKNPEAHCAQGQVFQQNNGDPDGHCVTDGVCGRCAMLAAAREAVDGPQLGSAQGAAADAIANITMETVSSAS